jgi:DNA-binding transcriptional MerR regulator
MMPDSKLSLKEMCAEFDVTPRTLRYYEYIELLSPEKVGRTRFYGAKEKARLKLILRGRRFGFSLEEIRQWLELYNSRSDNRTQMEKLVDMATEQIAELESRRDHLQEAIDELSELRAMTIQQLKQ